MDIENDFLEKECSKLKREFSNYFDWNDIDLTFFRVDVRNKRINVISNNYEWQLMYWGDDLDLLVHERLNPGIQYWSNYSDSFKKTLARTDKRNLKVDFCHHKNDIFKVITINTNKPLSLSDVASIYRYQPIISNYAYQMWKQTPEIVLPMRAEISLLSNNSVQQSNEQLANYYPVRFGNIHFTTKEILTIRVLLSYCRVKEISDIQGCSEISEHKHIQSIKEKLGCPQASPSGLFKALKEHGVTLACLDTFVNLT